MGCRYGAHMGTPFGLPIRGTCGARGHILVGSQWAAHMGPIGLPIWDPLESNLGMLNGLLSPPTGAESQSSWL